MDAKRRAKLESLLLEELSTALNRLVKDPRVPALTVTSVRLAADGGVATVSIALMGRQILPDDEARAQMESCLEGLTSAAGFIRRHMAKIINTRTIPNFIFKEDKGLENSMRVYELLKQLDAEKIKRDSSSS